MCHPHEISPAVEPRKGTLKKIEVVTAVSPFTALRAADKHMLSVTANRYATFLGMTAVSALQ
jgi:hypothetical protein